jgi:hypothetical protein
VINGLVTPSDFAPNPDGIPTGLTVNTYRNSLSFGEVPDQDEVSVTVVHGATDAPTIDLELISGGTSVGTLPGFSYTVGSFIAQTNGELLPASNDFDVNVIQSANGDTVGSFQLPLTQYGGDIITVFASGLLDTSDNMVSDDEPLVFAIARANGSVDIEPLTVGTEDREQVFEGVSMFPNPVRDGAFQLAFELEQPASDVQLRVIDMTGRTVLRRDLGRRNAGYSRERIDVGALNSGQYILQVQDQHRVKQMPFQVAE